VLSPAMGVKFPTRLSRLSQDGGGWIGLSFVSKPKRVLEPPTLFPTTEAHGESDKRSY